MGGAAPLIRSGIEQAYARRKNFYAGTAAAPCPDGARQKGGIHRGGVSHRTLIEEFVGLGAQVTLCDRKDSLEQFGPYGETLRRLGCVSAWANIIWTVLPDRI